MGLIRKTLAIGTLGTVKGNSKKQRVAKQLVREQRMTNRLMAQAEANEIRRATAIKPMVRHPSPELAGESSSFSDQADQLIKLAALLDKGLVTDNEFAEFKQRLLGN